jgi:tetratricopeptide (TPR) repeat protein
MQRAAWRLEDGQADAALADANRAVELASGNLQLLMYRSHVLQHLGRHKEAVEDWKKIDQSSEMSGIPERSTALNGLAYAQALGQLELDDALNNASKATQLAPGSGAIRDTRGYLLYLKGAYAAALEEMNLAVRGMEAETAAAKRNRQPVAGPQFADLADLDRGVAVVRYHRALVLLALGRQDEAEEDLDRVRELVGSEPDETLF